MSKFEFEVYFVVGRVEGLLTLLRAVPYNVSKRRVYLPTDLLMERDLSAEEVGA